MQVGIDKETGNVYLQEIEQVKAQIAADNRKISDLNNLITARNQKLLTVTKQAATISNER
jgi:hypothetical protein